MPRQVRIEYPGAIYHVMARGNRRERIVIDDEDRRSFESALEEVVGKMGWTLYAWVLMTKRGQKGHACTAGPQAYPNGT